MAKQRWNQSIVRRIRGMSRRTVAALIVPVIVSLTLMLVFAGRYSRSVARMGAIAALKPVISDEIPGAVWQVVSGRETMAESPVYALIGQANRTIAEITQELEGNVKAVAMDGNRFAVLTTDTSGTTSSAKPISPTFRRTTSRKALSRGISSTKNSART